MRTTGIVAALLLAVSLFTPGQGWGDEMNESYFPLKEGLRWEYNVIPDRRGQQLEHGRQAGKQHGEHKPDD